MVYWHNVPFSSETFNMLTAPSHQSDDNWNKALQGNFNYNFLRDLSVPLPLDGKNKIIVLIGHLDGMGDFAHGLEFAKMVTLCTKEKGYEVVGAVVTCVDFGSEQQSKALKKAVSENRHIFDELYLFDQDDPIPEDLKKSAGKSACMLTVSFDPFIGLFSYLPPKTIQIRCLEFGSDSRTYIRDCDFDNANMGLNLNQAHCNGILLKEPPKEEPLHLMASIKNKDFVTALVCGKNYDDYLRDHVFIPGYLQCSTSATVFIVSNVLRFFDHGELKKSCDFFLPSHMIEEKSILAALCALGLSSSLIQFITPESSERELIKTSTISIFSGFNLDDDDYSKLYYLQSDVAGCSGDNTTALVLSSNRLPYFQNKCGPLGHFYSDLYKFVHFIEKQQEHDPKSQQCFKLI